MYVKLWTFKKIRYICSINSAAWQWHLSALHTTEFIHRVLTWLGIGWLTSQNAKNKGSCSSHFTVACSWALLLKPCSPAPLLKLIWARLQSGQYSSLSGFCITLIHLTCAKRRRRVSLMESAFPGSRHTQADSANSFNFLKSYEWTCAPRQIKSW